MDSESSLFSPTGWCFCLTPTHRSTQALVYFHAAKIGFVSFHSQSQICPFSPIFFFLLLDLFKSTPTPHSLSFYCSAIDPITLCLLSPPFLHSLPWQDGNLGGYSQTNVKKSDKATIKVWSMQRWPKSFIQSKVRRITAQHRPDQLCLQTITPMV